MAFLIEVGRAETLIDISISNLKGLVFFKASKVSDKNRLCAQIFIGKAEHCRNSHVNHERVGFCMFRNINLIKHE